MPNRPELGRSRASATRRVGVAAPRVGSPVVDRMAEQLRELVPALAFLLAGVPLAALLDRLGFFESVANLMIGHSRRGMPVAALWALAAVTTIVLNLDTTIVLLTPLYLRLARRTGTDELAAAVVPLLLAGLASSVLPVSNLTTLIAAEHYGLSTTAVLAHLAVPSVVAVGVGWLAYRVRHPRRLPAVQPGPVDRRALRWGGAVVGGVLVGFVFGPLVGIDAWIVAVVGDVVLMTVTRVVPWREIPLGTAALVGAVAALVAAVVPLDAADRLAEHGGGAAIGIVTLAGAAGAGIVNNLPALLASLGSSTRIGWAGWAWLLGVNAGAVLVPTGALANLLWLRIMRSEGTPVRWSRYIGAVVPIALPAFLAATLTLVAEHALGIGA